MGAAAAAARVRVRLAAARPDRGPRAGVPAGPVRGGHDPRRAALDGAGAQNRGRARGAGGAVGDTCPVDGPCPARLRHDEAMHYAYLGPEGTFTEAAVASLVSSQRPEDVE